MVSDKKNRYLIAGAASMTTVLVEMCVTRASSVKSVVRTLIPSYILCRIETVVMGTLVPRDIIVVTSVL